MSCLDELLWALANMRGGRGSDADGLGDVHAWAKKMHVCMLDIYNRMLPIAWNQFGDTAFSLWCSKKKILQR